MISLRSKIFCFFLLILLQASCSEETSLPDQVDTVIEPIFRPVSSSETGIDFRNQLEHTERINTYTYRNFYNGAGVAIGDINNDGLPDLYFAGNQVDNKLYLNKGNFEFEDITETAGVACADVWSTGVSMADVNGDGLLDIYVCKSGPPEGPNRQNELFINNGDMTFTEQGSQWNVDDKGLSNHAVFFDYDRDGDLDMYLLNNSLRSIGVYDLRTGQRDIRDPDGGNKLYRNEGDQFTDVSEEAGIYGSAIGFGLGVTVADVNRDMWPDLFVSNDFFERDYLYLNKQDGTFAEQMTELTTETSMGSMGADIADLNNDGYPEIYVSEMLPSSLERIKTKTLFENWDKYQSNVRNGYFHQFTRNVLQYNNGRNPEDPNKVSFSEVSRLTNTHATDWSWGALLFDADNNGYRDIFVANGIYKDLTDQDYINFYSNNEILISRHRQDSTILTTLIEKIPSVPLQNALFLNSGDMTFQDASGTLPFEGFSNGAAYGDIDNDGDLDLIVNNINSTALIYENQSAAGAYVQLELKGASNNSGAFGSQIDVYTDAGIFYAEHQPVKGYMSSMDHRLHMGLGDASKIDSMIIRWPGGAVESLSPTINSLNQLDEPATAIELPSAEAVASSGLLTRASIAGLDTVMYTENDFNDFNRDQLLFEMYSNEGPVMETADLNRDGLEDIILGGSSGSPLRVFLQNAGGGFKVQIDEAFVTDKRSEDSAILPVDIDGDGDLDIYVGSGGNEFSLGDPSLKDRLYRNDEGSFVRDDSYLPRVVVPAESTGFVLARDLDSDGDQDLIIGERLQAFTYGLPANARVWRNNGVLEDITQESAPDFEGLGLLTDAVWADVDEAPGEELVMVGEWMRPVAFSWADGKFTKLNTFDNVPTGLYKTVTVADLNGDGVSELILGNHGLNSRLKADSDRPVSLFVNDYDRNGRLDHILSVFEGEKQFPLNLLQDLSKQIPVIRKSYATFESYGGATTDKVLSTLNREGETVLQAEELASIILSRDGNSWLTIRLPWQAQVSPIYSILSEDLDGDGMVDLILGGNQTKAKPELGIYKASYGLVLKGLGENSFESLTPSGSGFFVPGEIRAIRPMVIDGRRILVVGRNSNTLVCYR